ncbi:MAG: hypothetical protein HN919_15610 [Verrucomicrobia bacterium]|nr:hypothetical protein [Verrucomicrobiota bacterium]
MINLICLISFIFTVAMIRHPACSEAPSPCEKKLTRIMLTGFCIFHGIRWLAFVIMPVLAI